MQCVARTECHADALAQTIALHEASDVPFPYPSEFDLDPGAHIACLQAVLGAAQLACSVSSERTFMVAGQQGPPTPTWMHQACSTMGSACPSWPCSQMQRCLRQRCRSKHRQAHAPAGRLVSTRVTQCMQAEVRCALQGVPDCAAGVGPLPSSTTSVHHQHAAPQEPLLRSSSIDRWDPVLLSPAVP